jgi:hypothetical protein
LMSTFFFILSTLPSLVSVRLSIHSSRCDKNAVDALWQDMSVRFFLIEQPYI